MSNICGKIGDVCANTSWEIWGSTQIFAKNPYLQEKQFKGKHLWKSGFKSAFNVKTQFVGRITLKQICPKLFPALLSLFLLFGFMQGSVSPKAPAAYVTPSPRILRSSSRCLACHLATLYFLCWCCTLFSACLTLSESLLLASILALSLTVSPTFSMTACFVEAPPLKCKAAEEAANCTLLLQYHLCLGHLFHTRELMDSIALRV